MVEQPRHRAGAAHAMPLVAQAAGGQRHGVARVAGFGHGFEGFGEKPGAAICSGEQAVVVQPRFADARALRVRPLLRAVALQDVPRQAGDVEVAASGAFTVLVPDGFRAGVGEEGEPAVQPCGQQGLEPMGEVHRNRPVVTCLAGGLGGGAHAADAALGVGHRPILFAPGGSGQQHVGIRHGGGGGVGLLHHDEFGGLQRATHQRLVGQRLGGVGAGDPQRLHLAVGRGLEQLDGGLAAQRRHVGHTPEFGHFGAVRGVGQITMRRQQIGHATHFAPAHGVGLAGERKRPRTRLADLAAGQVKVDEPGVLRRAAARLVQPLAIHGKRGLARLRCRVRRAQREPARGGDDVLRR